MSRRTFRASITVLALVLSLCTYDPAPARASASLVQAIGTGSSFAGVFPERYAATITVGAAVAAGDSILLVMYAGSDAPFTCGDSAGNTYTNDLAPDGTGPSGIFPGIFSSHGVTPLATGDTIVCSAGSPLGGGGS